MVTGVSGSGKSTLVNDILYRALAREIYGSHDEPGAHDSIEGLELIDKVIHIDQSPIGRTPRSNPATYTGLFTPIRDLYAMLPESRERGYKPGRFSFNVKGGRCEACQGDGLKRIEMNFLPDVYVTCDVCRGRRYNRETLQVKYKGYSIADLLEATVEEALPLMENLPQIRAKLQTLLDVGLGYVHLGQSSTTLSGGEAQRIKLAHELSKRQTGRTFYLLDEPTTGLHFDDVRKLLDVLQRLVDLGNTVVVIEHNLDVIKTADWIIDLGPDGGEYGGRVVAAARPSRSCRSKKSYTAEALRKVLRHGRSGMSKYGQQPASISRGLQDRLACRERGGKVGPRISRRRTAPGSGIAGWLDSLPHILAADSFRAVVGCPRRRARARKRAILWGLGGHVIKCGLAPVLIDLMRRGYATGFRAERRGRDSRFRNRPRRPNQRRRGSRAARWPLRRGRGDRPRDEPRHRGGRPRGHGHRRSARAWLERRAGGASPPSSLLLQAYRNRTPVTVHVAIGTDTPHTHPAADARGHRRRLASRFPPASARWWRISTMAASI